MSLIIASDDWFWRSITSLAAHRCERFRDIFVVEDGYLALAQVWQCVEDGGPPDVCVLDARGGDVSLPRLVTELRADETTRHVYLVAIGEEGRAIAGVDQTYPSCVDSDELIRLLDRIASSAQALRRL